MGIGELLITLAGVIWAFELTPQLIKTLRVKKTEDISLAFFVMTTIAYAIYTIGNFILENFLIIIVHIPSIIFNLTMIYLIIKYRREG